MNENATLLRGEIGDELDAAESQRVPSVRDDELDNLLDDGVVAEAGGGERVEQAAHDLHVALVALVQQDEELLHTLLDVLSLLLLLLLLLSTTAVFAMQMVDDERDLSDECGVRGLGATRAATATAAAAALLLLLLLLLLAFLVILDLELLVVLVAVELHALPVARDQHVDAERQVETERGRYPVHALPHDKKVATKDPLAAIRILHTLAPQRLVLVVVFVVVVSIIILFIVIVIIADDMSAQDVIEDAEWATAHAPSSFFRGGIEHHTAVQVVHSPNERCWSLVVNLLCTLRRQVDTRDMHLNAARLGQALIGRAHQIEALAVTGRGESLGLVQQRFVTTTATVRIWVRTASIGWQWRRWRMVAEVERGERALEHDGESGRAELVERAADGVELTRAPRRLVRAAHGVDEEQPTADTHGHQLVLDVRAKRGKVARRRRRGGGGDRFARLARCSERVQTARLGGRLAHNQLAALALAAAAAATARRRHVHQQVAEHLATEHASLARHRRRRCLLFVVVVVVVVG